MSSLQAAEGKVQQSVILSESHPNGWLFAWWTLGFGGNARFEHEHFVGGADLASL